MATAPASPTLMTGPLSAKQAAAASAAIDKTIRSEQRARMRKGEDELKLLLLGPSGAGKTTFMRQMRGRYDADALAKERHLYRSVIALSILRSTHVAYHILDRGGSRASMSEYDSLLAFLALEQDIADYVRTNAPGTAAQESFAAFAATSTTMSTSTSSSSSSPDINGRGAASFDTGETLLDVSNSASNHSRLSLVPSMSSDAFSERDEQRDKRQSRVRIGSPALRSDDVFTPTPVPSAAAAGGRSGERDWRAHTAHLLVKDHHHSHQRDLSQRQHYEAQAERAMSALVMARDDIRKLWDECVGRGLVAGRGLNAHLPGGFAFEQAAMYFFDNIDRVANEDYMPTNEDLFNVRVKTIGVETHRLKIRDSFYYSISDVAGARGTKHVWAPYFDDCAAIIFITSLADYAEPHSRSKPRENRMTDAIALFRDILSNPILSGCTMILFLNKLDLLRQKVKGGHHPVSTYFPGYNGKPDSWRDSLMFLRERFLRCNVGNDRPVYTHCTQATDSKTILFTIDAINDVLLSRSLKEASLI